MFGNKIVSGMLGTSEQDGTSLTPVLKWHKHDNSGTKLFVINLRQYFLGTKLPKGMDLN